MKEINEREDLIVPTLPTRSEMRTNLEHRVNWTGQAINHILDVLIDLGAITPDLADTPDPPDYRRQTEVETMSDAFWDVEKARGPFARLAFVMALDRRVDDLHERVDAMNNRVSKRLDEIEERIDWRGSSTK